MTVLRFGKATHAHREVATAPNVTVPQEYMPLYHAAVRVISYLATVIPDQVSPTAIETFQRQAVLVDIAELTPSTSAADLPFGLPARYWLELRDYERGTPSRPESTSRCSSSKEDAATRCHRRRRSRPMAGGRPGQPPGSRYPCP
ncbi:hypothetical protein [Streptomyces sp. NPDC042319]|uniref:hypothetical protein n=1 Tax=Streptomyces sp. NPDC042319 TaxID=3154332 RepID=UPI0033E92B01